MATKYRNYFRGFPFLTGYQYGTYRSKAGEAAKPLRLAFSGNDSAYGRTLPMVYGKCRIADPILLIAKPEGDFLTTLWAVAEGLLGTNATSDAQTTPSDAYVKTSGVENIYVNGVSRHDPRPGYGIEVYNGDQDRPEPGSAFFPAGAGQIDDFITNNLGFWGTARVTFRINTKSNPSVDVAGQSITGAFEIAYGRIHRVYTTDASTYVRRATANGSTAGANPAYVLMDVLVSKRAGGGLDYSRLNIQSFKDVGDYCNGSVTSTFDGSTVNRWTFNGMLDQRKSLQEWLHLLSISMYCLPPFVDASGTLKIKALKSESTSGVPLFSSKVASATARNIVWDGNHSSLVKSRRPISQVPNEIRVNFVENVTYSKISIVISDRDSQTAFGTNFGDQSRRVLMKSIDLPGVTTIDEAARIGTLILRAGEFGQGGLSNNLKITFKAFYRDCEDLEIGDIIEAEDDLLNASLNERYFRVTRMTVTPMSTSDGGIVLGREIEAVLHANAIYDDTALTVSKFDRIAPPSPSDFEAPAVTGFGVAEGGVFDGNNKLTTQLTITFTEPTPKNNYRCVALHVCTDDGAGNPIGDWRYIGDIYTSGEVIGNFEVTNTRKHFCAVSRALSGHVPDVDAKLSDGSYRYPRISVVVDGITDTLPAPTNFVIFIGSNLIGLSWDKYTGNDAKLFKSFRLYRNTINDLGTATLIATLDGTRFIENNVTPATTYYYWVKGYSVLEAEGAAAGPVSSAAPSNSGVDASIPTAPLIGTDRGLASFNSNEYSWTVGIDRPGGASNWNGITSTELQISTDITFASFPTGQSLDRSTGSPTGPFRFAPPFTQEFRVNHPGTYYMRARVNNSFGSSAWSLTLTRITNLTDNVTPDTDLCPAVTPTLAVQSGGPHIAGNAFEISFEVPTSQSASYWGHSEFIHDSGTLPTATTQDTGTAGAISAGVSELTDLTKAWGVNAWANKDVVIFSDKRGGSPTWDYEGCVIISKITSNTATKLVFDLPTQRQTRTLTGIKYYIVNRGVGDHFYEKLKFAGPWFVNEGVTALTDERSTRQRKVLISTGLSTVYVWVSCANAHGHGKVTATPPNATFAGISSNEIKTGAVLAGKLTANSQGWSTNIVFSASDYRTVAWTSGSIKLADGTTISISSGNTGSMAAQTFIYLDRDVSNTVLQVTTTYSNAVGENKILLCTAQNTADTSQNAWFVPAVGPLGVNETVIGPNSISTNKIQAASITATKISVATLDAITVNAGTITAGTFIGTTFKTASSGQRIEIDSTNGLRGYNSGGTLSTQIVLADGYIRTTFVRALDNVTPVSIVSNSLNAQVIVGDTGTGYVSIYANSTLTANVDSNGFNLIVGAVKLNSTTVIDSSRNITGVLGTFTNGLLIQKSSSDRFEVDDSDSSTQTAMLVRQDGSKRRVKTEFVAADTWGAGSPAADINVLYVN